MKTITKKYFICDICGKVSQAEEKIKKCQSLHRIINDECKIELLYNKGKEFPRLIYVTWPDGETKSYFYNIRDNKA